MPGRAGEMFKPELPPTHIFIRREWAEHTRESRWASGGGSPPAFLESLFDDLSPQARHLVIFPIRLGVRRLFSWSYVGF